MTASSLVLLSFWGLADDANMARIQKELLLQSAYVTTLVTATDVTYIEGNVLSAADLNSLPQPAADLSLRCISCQVPPGEELTYKLISSKKADSTNNDAQRILSLKIQWISSQADAQATPKYTNWKVALFPSCYAVTAERSFQPGDIFKSFQAKIAAIENSGNNHGSCASPQFPSLWQAQAALQKWDGSEIKFHTSKNQRLQDEIIQKTPTIRAKSDVTVLLQSTSGITLRTPGTALDAASIGQTMRVEIPNPFGKGNNSTGRKKTIMATVKSSQEVQGNIK